MLGDDQAKGYDASPRKQQREIRARQRQDPYGGGYRGRIHSSESGGVATSLNFDAAAAGDGFDDSDGENKFGEAKIKEKQEPD